MLTVEVRSAGLITVLEPDGDLDVVSAPELRSRLEEQLAAGRTALVVDLSRVPFVDSTGLGTLVAVSRQAGQAGGGLKLAAPRDGVVRVLALTRMREFFDVSDSVDEALRRFSAGSV